MCLSALVGWMDAWCGDVADVNPSFLLSPDLIRQIIDVNGQNI